MPVEVNRESGRFPRKHCPFGPLGALHIISLRRVTVLYMMAPPLNFERLSGVNITTAVSTHPAADAREAKKLGG